MLRVKLAACIVDADTSVQGRDSMTDGDRCSLQKIDEFHFGVCVRHEG